MPSPPRCQLCIAPINPLTMKLVFRFSAGRKSCFTVLVMSRLNTTVRICIAHHVAADNADPRDAHDESDDVVLLVLRPRTVWNGEAERHHEGEAEDKQEALRPPLGPREPVLLASGSRTKLFLCVPSAGGARKQNPDLDIYFRNKTGRNAPFSTSVMNNISRNKLRNLTSLPKLETEQ